MEKFDLWEKAPGMCEETPTVTYYEPKKEKTDIAIIIFPGGGYCMRAEHEGKGYAEFLSENGYHSFVVDYRVSPHTFPIPLADARRAVRFVRFNAEKFGISKSKIAVMGSSAGGHLAAMLSTYKNPIDFENADEIDKEDFMPQKQILCYPVISLDDDNITHKGSGDSLLGQPAKSWDDKVSRMKLSPNLIADDKTPEAFIWHTFSDDAVNVKNSLFYAARLKSFNVKTELHIFPDGNHGMGIPKGDGKVEKHVGLWPGLLLEWLKYTNW